jgi:hypothetical protein
MYVEAFFDRKPQVMPDLRLSLQSARAFAENSLDRKMLRLRACQQIDVDASAAFELGAPRSPSACAPHTAW